jgi:hypothetical protein
MYVFARSGKQAKLELLPLEVMASLLIDNPEPLAHDQIAYPRLVDHFLRTNSNAYFCDQCVCKALELPITRKQQVKQITTTLGLCAGFDRRQGQCSACHYQKMVIEFAESKVLAAGV